MAEVLVFDALEDVKLAFHDYLDKNDEALKGLHNLQKQKEQEYRAATKYDESVVNEQKEEFKKICGDRDFSRFIIDPKYIDLPKETKKDLFKELGKGFEFYGFIGITKSERTEYYYFNGDALNMPGQFLFLCDDFNYMSSRIRKALIEVQDELCGASIDTIFYTADNLRDWSERISDKEISEFSKHMTANNKV